MADQGRDGHAQVDLPLISRLGGEDMTQMIPELPQVEQHQLLEALLGAARESRCQRLSGTPEAHEKAAAKYRELWRDDRDEYVTKEGGE